VAFLWFMVWSGVVLLDTSAYQFCHNLMSLIIVGIFHALLFHRTQGKVSHDFSYAFYTYLYYIIFHLFFFVDLL